MKKIYYLILITVVISSCKQECKETINSAMLVDKIDFNCIVPYNGYEKLKFLRNNTDTVIFYGQGIRSEYQYTTTQDDCPSKIPLENKYLIFVDSVFNNSFVLQLYVNYQAGTYCKVIINNKTIYNGYTSGIISLSIPYISLNVLGVKYDSLSYLNSSDNYFYYKKCTLGMLKFKSNNDIFELIP
jgi:hypothetical protein